MSIVLNCTDGPLAGEAIPLDGALEFGRECTGAGALGGDTRLSRHHARISIGADGRLVIDDLGSTNGTWVNGARVDGRRVLEHGDRVLLGRSRLEVSLSDPTVPEGAATEPEGHVGAAATTAVGERPHFTVLAGPLQGSEIAVGDELLIGRGYGEPGALGGDQLLSRRHARVARGHDGRYYVDDSGSTNGTKLNHERLRGTHVLVDGDELEVGGTQLQAGSFPDAEAAHEASYAMPSAIVPQGAAASRLSRRAVVGTFAGVFAAALAAAVAAVLLAAPLGSSSCAQGFVCQTPPRTPPLRDLATFTGGLGWRVEYDASAVRPDTASVAGNRIVLTESGAQDHHWGLSAGSKLILIEIRAFASAQTSPAAAMQNLAGSLTSNLVGSATAPDSDLMFAKPVLGFHTALGEVLEGDLRTPQGPGSLQKIAVLAASSGRVTIAAAVAYPVQVGQTQQNNPDQPLDQFGDAILETVRFPSDGAT